SADNAVGLFLIQLIRLFQTLRFHIFLNRQHTISPFCSFTVRFIFSIITCFFTFVRNSEHTYCKSLLDFPSCVMEISQPSSWIITVQPSMYQCAKTQPEELSRDFISFCHCDLRTDS